MNKFIIGIISSLFLILFYLEGGIVDLFIPNIEWINEMNETVFRLIFTLSFIGFYYSLSKYFKNFGQMNFIKIINAMVITEIISIIIRGVDYFIFLLPGFIITILYITGLVLFIVFGIKALMINDNQFINLKNLKTFIIVMFIAFGLVLISIAIITFIVKFELINVIFTIYAIPYIFGLIFFIKINNQKQLTQK